MPKFMIPVLLLALSAAFVPAPVPAGQGESHMMQAFEAYALQKMGDYEQAFALWLALAEDGSIQGMLNAAHMLQAGKGVEIDAAKALHWYLEAAERDSSIGMYYAAVAYDEGIGTPPNEKRAVELYRRAAEADFAQAQVALAEKLQEQGQREQARAWLERAAAAGNSTARMKLHGAGAAQTADAQISAERRKAVRSLLTALDAAANARDAAALTRHIAADARIQVDLPGAAGAQTLSPAAYRTLWQKTFAKPERYRFDRLQVELGEQGSQLRVVSEMVETFTADGRTRRLRLHETLLVSLDGEAPVITAVELDVRVPEKSAGQGPATPPAGSGAAPGQAHAEAIQR